MHRTSIRMMLAAGICIGAAIGVRAQDLLRGSGPGSRPILINSDVAVLEGGEPRKDLNCSIAPSKVSVGLDLKFHAGFSVTLPLQDLQGGGNLTIIFHVSEKSADGNSAYFGQRIRVPQLTEMSGDASIGGSFDVGEGDYNVDWLLRDFIGRYCSSSWDITATLTARDKQVTLALPPHFIGASQEEPFQAEPPVERAGMEVPLNVKVLMNFAPQRPDAAVLTTEDRMALLSILRNLSRNPYLGKISLVTFNVQQERVLYRQGFADQIDFPALGRALKSLSLGTVDLRALGNKNGGIEFLSSLTRNEVMAGEDVDGLIFVGPKSLPDFSIPEDELRHIVAPDYPVFYLNYAADPLAVPWRDAIGKMVKFLKGREYTISGAHDLAAAVSEAMERMAKLRQTRPAATPSGANGPH
jgi:hypothetical protein